MVNIIDDLPEDIRKDIGDLETVHKLAAEGICREFGINPEDLSVPKLKLSELPRHISVEWAKQLAFWAFGPGLDFANMKVYAMPESKPFMYKVVIEHPMFFRIDTPTYITDVEVVYTSMWWDDINNEITPIGYSFKANKLIIGMTSVYKKAEI